MESIKSFFPLPLHLLLPWYYCLHFHPMTRTSAPHPPPAVRLISSDGRLISTFRRPVLAGDLMSEHPHHLICRSDSFLIGHKVPSLSPTDSLQLGHTYFLLPSHFFHSVLSFVTALSLLKLDGKTTKFDVRKNEEGVLMLHLSLMEEEEEEEEERGLRVCTSEELEKEYKRLVGGKLRQWKPRLETITESKSSCSSKSRSTRKGVMLLIARKKS